MLTLISQLGVGMRFTLPIKSASPSFNHSSLLHYRLSSTSAFPEAYDKTMTLRDGRTLAWAEAGCPTGYPLLFFHGFPGSRLEARGTEEMGRRQKVRFICPERPGYGRSTFQPGRRITDWPQDVQQLAGQLGLKRYAVLGGSAGGPFALACAHAIPSDTLSAVGLTCTAAPWEAGTRDLLWSAHIGSWAASHGPRATTRLLDALLNMAGRYAASESGKKALDALTVRAARTAGKDIAADPSPDAVLLRRERLQRILLEPFAQGSHGFVHEAHLLSHPYGFRLEDVDKRIQIWHGTKDRNSPIGMVRYMRDRLPNCHLKELEGEDHFSIIKHMEDIVKELVNPVRHHENLGFAKG